MTARPSLEMADDGSVARSETAGPQPMMRPQPMTPAMPMATPTGTCRPISRNMTASPSRPVVRESIYPPLFSRCHQEVSDVICSRNSTRPPVREVYRLRRNTQAWTGMQSAISVEVTHHQGASGISIVCVVRPLAW